MGRPLDGRHSYPNYHPLVVLHALTSSPLDVGHFNLPVAQAAVTIVQGGAHDLF
jgi:hypothetical protein